ncbi:CpaD family pilus assembly lipoprotein [Sphingomonas sp.]|jgi:pilus assembly protein CpaD|uniref:CpaD family pilus assembly lipoprotein n=1 Tax=Sphingomonas sp. TaxID=28214 RepID=UPI002D8086AA|nr:CpaD family pilus assembly lipoprotein [Sphingomonas sp.]HEU0044056.1 CpaD family pilus assembly lipoprotein [Sphingomonas sp.]
MPTRSLLLAALTPALLLGACTAGGTQNRGLESVHQPVVDRQDFVFDVRTAGDSLAAGETRRLEGWLDSLRLRYGDKVTVDDPTGYRGVREDVAQSVAGFGLLLSEDRAISGAPVSPGSARIVVSRMVASVPGCPDHSRNASVNYNQHTSSNFGCAVNSGLAAMIAQPEDLIHGRGNGAGTDTLRSVKAIDAFRKAAPSGGGGTAVQGASTGGK